jgi:hypothetical protein
MLELVDGWAAGEVSGFGLSSWGELPCLAEPRGEDAARFGHVRVHGGVCHGCTLGKHNEEGHTPVRVWPYAAPTWIALLSSLTNRAFRFSSAAM